MIPANRGAIVDVGSYARFQAFPTIGAYAASKGALAQLTRVLSLEAIDHGILGTARNVARQPEISQCQAQRLRQFWQIVDEQNAHGWTCKYNDMTGALCHADCLRLNERL